MRSKNTASNQATPIAPAHLLAGATVVVTRPSASSTTLKRRIAALGGTALGLPAIGVRASADAQQTRSQLHTVRDADVVVFVSPTAVRFAFALEPGLRFGRATQVCAIGGSTAKALQRRGIAQALWPEQRQDSEGLLALPPFSRLRGRRVALIGAPGGRDVLPTTLRARKAQVLSVSVYARTLPRLDRRHFAKLQGAATPLLTLISSAEALANLRAVLPGPCFEKLARGDTVVSSLRVATRARAAGMQRVHIAASARDADLLATAIGALAQHRL